MKEAKFECEKCKHKFDSQNFITSCHSCGHKYVKWTNYDKMFGKKSLKQLIKESSEL